MAPIIESVYAFFHRNISREHDIRHKSGEAYSPGERDIAQSVRDNLAVHLARIPGNAPHESLRRLAVSAKDRPEEVGLQALLRNHASEGAARLVLREPKDIPRLGDVYCRELRSEAELFEVVLARLEAIKDSVESGRFSERVLFERGMEEKSCRRGSRRGLRRHAAGTRLGLRGSLRVTKARGRIFTSIMQRERSVWKSSPWIKCAIRIRSCERRWKDSLSTNTWVGAIVVMVFSCFFY